MHVIPITVRLGGPATNQAAADGQKDRLVALLKQPMVQTMVQSRGVPVVAVQSDVPCHPYDGTFLAYLWVFIDAPTQESAVASRNVLSTLLAESGVKGVAKLNGVAIDGVSVGEVSVYQPRR